MTSEDGPSVELQYLCHACSEVWTTITVRERGAQEDLYEWMELVRNRIFLHHAQVSPSCLSRHVDLKVLLAHNKNARIGHADRQ